MRNLIILIALLLVCAVCFALGSIAPENQVIIDSVWVPTESQTQTALVHIFNYMTNIKANTDNLHLIDNSKYILDNISDYAVQFKGIIKDNKQIIYCNFFPKNNIYADWQENIVFVDDGGFWYWQIEYDLQTGQCFNFFVNNNA